MVYEVVGRDRLAGDPQPPSLPLLRRLRGLFGEEERVGGQWTALFLLGEQAERVLVERRLDLLAPSCPIVSQGRVIGGCPSLDHYVPDDVGPGELRGEGRGARGTEHPSVIPELVAFTEVLIDDPVLRLVG